jgi:hypothetical protein
MTWGRPQIGGAYDWATFTLNSGTTDYNVKTNQATLFLNIPIAKNVFIWSSQDISFKFNNTANPAIGFAAVSDGESPFEGRDMLLVSNIFLTNAGANNATIKILLSV